MSKLPFPYVDYDSQYLITMTPEHHLRQLGGSYVWEYASFSALAVSASVYIEIITPAFTVGAKEIAWKPSNISCDQLLKSEFFEAPTVTDGTNRALTSNQNRASSNTASTIIYTNATAVSGGTLLRTRLEGTGTNAKPVGIGSDINDLGWQLKPNTKYVIKLTNIGQQATTFLVINGQFFEITRD